ncbi:MAG: hypothetical protein HGA59_05155 [Chlorobiaceae bacterium]|jgi:hypothetical protein|nr:hypothetical protein [Chlorobiaceae bacterium]NTV16307.1 hypothetical protein [Chlorobiaceae bacterium]
MLKFILLVLFLFLVLRMVLRMLKKGLFFFNKGASSHSESASGSFSSERHIEEADYEVISSRLNNKEQDAI